MEHITWEEVGNELWGKAHYGTKGGTFTYADGILVSSCNIDGEWKSVKVNCCDVEVAKELAEKILMSPIDIWNDDEEEVVSMEEIMFALAI
jgi:hypothetical protein